MCRFVIDRGCHDDVDLRDVFYLFTVSRRKAEGDNVAIKDVVKEKRKEKSIRNGIVSE